MSALSDLLNRVIDTKYPDRPRDPSNRKLAQMAGISRGTVDNYLNGAVLRPTEDVLQAFHRLLAIPIQDLREAAGLPRGEGAPYTPPIEANLLSRRQRDTLDAFIRAVVEDRGAADALDTAKESGAPGEARSPQKSGSDDDMERRATDAVRGIGKAPKKGREVQ